MPIYEYACPHCKKKFEEWLKSIDDAASHACPVCGTASPRVISQTTFILKGGGWYVTEYGSHHAETEDAPAGTDATESKTDGVVPAKTDNGKATDAAAPASAATSAHKPNAAQPAAEKPAASPGTPAAKPATANHSAASAEA